MPDDRAAASVAAFDDAPAGPEAPVSTSFITGFVIAQVGAYVSFLPLLQILVPLKAAALGASTSSPCLVSQIALLKPSWPLLDQSSGRFSERSHTGKVVAGGGPGSSRGRSWRPPATR